MFPKPTGKVPPPTAPKKVIPQKPTPDIDQAEVYGFVDRSPNKSRTPGTSPGQSPELPRSAARTGNAGAKPTRPVPATRRFGSQENLADIPMPDRAPPPPPTSKAPRSGGSNASPDPQVDVTYSEINFNKNGKPKPSGVVQGGNTIYSDLKIDAGPDPKGDVTYSDINFDRQGKPKPSGVVSDGNTIYSDLKGDADSNAPVPPVPPVRGASAGVTPNSPNSEAGAAAPSSHKKPIKNIFKFINTPPGNAKGSPAAPGVMGNSQLPELDKPKKEKSAGNKTPGTSPGSSPKGVRKLMDKVRGKKDPKDMVISDPITSSIGNQYKLSELKQIDPKKPVMGVKRFENKDIEDFHAKIKESKELDEVVRQAKELQERQKNMMTAIGKPPKSPVGNIGGGASSGPPKPPQPGPRPDFLKQMQSPGASTSPAPSSSGGTSATGGRPAMKLPNRKPPGGAPGGVDPNELANALKNRFK